MKDDIDALNLSVAAAASALGISRAQLHRVIAGESAVSPELALRLETVIGGSAESWLRMQAAYDATRIRERAGEITTGLRRLHAPAE